MLFSSKFIIKVYRAGDSNPSVTFAVVCQSAKLVDAHTLCLDGTVIKFSDYEYPVIAETYTE